MDIGTLGLLYLVGPYRCQCCGARRLFRVQLGLPKLLPMEGASRRRTKRRKKEVWREPFSLRGTLKKLVRPFSGSGKKRQSKKRQSQSSRSRSQAVMKRRGPSQDLSRSPESRGNQGEDSSDTVELH